MSVTKRISGDFNIVNKGSGLTTGNVTITTDTFFVNGNMLVGGTATSVTTTNSDISDNIIVLNKGETGSGVSTGYSGIQVDRGSAPDVTLRWNESLAKWELTADGSVYSVIATSASGTTLANVFQDPEPAISANLDLRGRTIFNTTSNISINGTVGGGGTGVYASNTLHLNQELINKTKALLYTVLL
jgi:hypothetical protein